jgi:hypothetical protein
MNLLPTQTLARLKHAADSGLSNAIAILHLLNLADQRDRDVAAFVDSYSKTIAALCRRLEALELVAGLRHPVEDDATESDSVADTSQRITDHAVQAGLTVQDWVNAFNAAPDGPIAAALIEAESALADVAEALAAIRPVMRRHGI